MGTVEKVIWVCSMTLAATFLGAIVLMHLIQEKPHTPKFTNNQCFVKGLQEPWDTEVTGKVIRVGYLKYLIMYASEADRKSLGTKQGWEEDIRTFDSKYNPAPCPKGWNHEK